MTEDTTETGSTDDGDPTGEDTTPTDQGGVYTAEEWAELQEEVSEADLSNATYSCVCGEMFLGEHAQQRYASHCRDCPVHTAAREADDEKAMAAAQASAGNEFIPDDPALDFETASGGGGGEESTPTPDTQAADDDDDDHSGPSILANDKWATRMFIGGWILVSVSTAHYNYYVHGAHPDGGLELILGAVIILPLLFFFELETAAIRSLAVALRNRKK